MNDGVNGAGTVAGFPYNWNTTFLGQFAQEPVGDQVEVLVDFEDFERKVEVEWSDGYKALVQNGLSGMGNTDDVQTLQRTVEWREKCDIVMHPVDYTVTFKQKFAYAVGPEIQQGTNQKYRKFTVTNNAVVGLTNPLVQWCETPDNKISDCGPFGGESNSTHKNHLRIKDIAGGDFRGCKGADDGDIGDHITFASTDVYTYLPSKVVCGNVDTVSLGSIDLDYRVTFELNPFDDTGLISVGSSSTLSGATKVEGYYFSPTPECQADGSVGTPGAGCGNATLDNYNKVRDKFGDCGSNKVMYVNHHLTFTMDNDDTVLKFCNSKKLSYTLEQQDGALSASITAAQRVGFDAFVSLENLRWQKCDGGYEQVMLLNFETDSPETLDDDDMVISTNDILHMDDAGTELNIGRIMLRSSCVDVCANALQMHTNATTTFTINIGDTQPEFSISSRIQGNPCGASQSVDGVPDMQLKVNAVDAAGDCIGRQTGASDLVIDENKTACFTLQLEDPGTDVSGRNLTTAWALQATNADGTIQSLNVIGDASDDDFLQHRTFYIPLNTYGGQQLTLHVEYSQVRASGGGFRRLRATYVLGAKDSDDADVSFTVLPAHVTVEDKMGDAELEDAPKDHFGENIPKDDAKDETVARGFYVSLMVLAIVMSLFGVAKIFTHVRDAFSGRSDLTMTKGPALEPKYMKVGRFDSSVRY